MKIRSGFVSNSSSSSFVCDVCSESVSGMDMGLSEAEMSECKEGHIFCDCHMSVVDFYSLNLEEKRAYCLDRVEDKNTRDNINDVKTEEDEEVLDDIYSDEIECEERYNISKKDCPCCSLKNPTNSQIMEFLFYETKSNRNDTVKSMRKKFKDYDDMKDKLK